MGVQPVTPPTGVGVDKWGLTRTAWADIQSVVASGLGQLPWGRALFLHASSEGGAWVSKLRELAPINKGSGPAVDEDGLPLRVASIAFTWTGLKQMKLDAAALATFSAPFCEGMHQEDRRRRLRDEAHSGTVVPEGLQWSGNTPAGDGTPAAPATPKTVHALLLLYDWDEEAAEWWAVEIERALAGVGVTVVHRLSLTLGLDSKGDAREHFGFTDGKLQPAPYLTPPVGPDETYRWHGIPVGDVLMGYRNAHDEDAPSPFVKVIPRAQDLLQPTGAPEGFLNLGLNGTYMVVRELRQDVAAFWNSLDRIAASMPTQGNTITAEWLASRIIGREMDGKALCAPGGTAPSDDNFGYLEHDAGGFGCPLGSHVRRANPRDGLAPTAASGQNLLDAANNHRIVRRGRNYGDRIANLRNDDGIDRGLLFICLNTDIARQFEFVQQTWLFNPAFATLFNETDPLVGPKGKLTIPENPLRRIIEVETYVKLAGGEYFFLPSIAALDYLQGLT